MSDKELITLLFFLIAFVLIIILIFKEIDNIKDIRETFKCKYCNNLSKELYNGYKCNRCNRIYKNTKIKFEHYLMFRVNEIDTSNKKMIYNYNKYIKYSKIEMTICIVSATILLISILLISFR